MHVSATLFQQNQCEKTSKQTFLSSVKPPKTLLSLCALSPTLTALLQGVASLQVITGPGRMFPAAVWALHVVDLAAEGLQCGLDAWVDRDHVGRVAVGQSLVLAELRRRRRAGVVILRAAEEVVHGSHGRSRWTGKTWGSGLSWRPLRI